eukprot:m.38796 g.38796  ORF g.38796 m.38796 type:complete len:136 (+) comp9473_c0_seq2:144-551(+)
MAQGKQVQAMQEKVSELIKELDERDIPWDYPEAVNEQHSNKFRLAGHTKGNTKNQRKQMKRQQEDFLSATILHLSSILEHAEETSKTHMRRGKSKVSKGKRATRKTATRPEFEECDESDCDVEDMLKANVPSLFS